MGENDFDRKLDELLSDADIRAELERLRSENEQLKKQADRGLSLRVSKKAAVSLYGLGRYPVTLYKGQWLRLLAFSSEIRAFIEAHESELSTRDRADRA